MAMIGSEAQIVEASMRMKLLHELDGGGKPKTKSSSKASGSTTEGTRVQARSEPESRLVSGWRMLRATLGDMRFSPNSAYQFGKGGGG
jgi:hypothetical protein